MTEISLAAWLAAGVCGFLLSQIFIAVLHLVKIANALTSLAQAHSSIAQTLRQHAPPPQSTPSRPDSRTGPDAW